MRTLRGKKTGLSFCRLASTTLIHGQPFLRPDDSLLVLPVPNAPAPSPSVRGRILWKRQFSGAS